MNYFYRMYFICECWLQQCARRFGENPRGGCSVACVLLIQYDMFMFKALAVHSLVCLLQWHKEISPLSEPPSVWGGRCSTCFVLHQRSRFQTVFHAHACLQCHPWSRCFQLPALLWSFGIFHISGSSGPTAGFRQLLSFGCLYFIHWTADLVLPSVIGTEQHEVWKVLEAAKPI